MTLPYPLRVDLAHSGIWNDITPDVYARDDLSSITIERGRRSEDATYSAGRANLSLKNTDGKYSPRNPNSPLYGLIGRGNQVRIGLGRPAIGKGSAVSGVSTTSLVAPSITAEVTGLQIVAFMATPQGNVTVPAGFTGLTEQDQGAWTVQAAHLASVGPGATGDETATYSLSATAYAAVNVHIPGASYGSGGSLTSGIGADVSFNFALTGGRTVLAICGWDDDPDDRMQPPRIAADDIGLSWYLVTDTGTQATGVPRIQVWAMYIPSDLSGSTAFNFLGKRDNQGVAWLRLAEVTGAAVYMPRFTGEVSEWPVTWDASGRDVATPITVSGIGRRLSVVNFPVNSSIKDALLVYPSELLGYWPLEDQSGATSFASAVPDGEPLTFVGTPALGVLGTAATEPLPTFTAAGAHASVPAAGQTGAFLAIGCVAQIGAAGTAVGANIFQGALTGTGRRIVCEWRSNTVIRFKFGSTDIDLTVTPGVNGKWYLFAAYLQQNGANVDYAVFAAPCSPGTTNVQATYSLSSTINSQTIGILTGVSVGLESDSFAATHTNAPVFGHLFASRRMPPIRLDGGSGDQLAPHSAQAWVAWDGQKASDRMHSVLASHGAKVQVQHNDVEQRMGPLVAGAPVANLTEAEKVAIGGSVFDAAGFLGLRHRGRVAKENQAARLTLVYDDGQIQALQPTDDDLYIANDVTVSRRGGSSARAVQVDGPLNVRPLPMGVGPYPRSEELQAFADTQLADQAGYRLAAGTVDKPRWPVLTFDLTHPNNSGLLTQMPAFDIGSEIALDALPSFVPGSADIIEPLMVEGWVESVSATRWVITMTCSPADVFSTFWLDPAVSVADAGNRIGDDGNLTLNEALDATETGVDIAVGTGAALTTRVADFPLLIEVGGELMEVASIAGSTLTVTRSVNGVVKSHSTGTQVRVYGVSILALDD